MEVQWEPYSKVLSEGIDAERVIQMLSPATCFDFEYVPVEGDRLIIQEPSTSFRRRVLSVIFHGRKWQTAHLPPHNAIEETLASGEIEFSECSRLNSLRSYLLKKITSSETNSTGLQTYLKALLNQLESFDRKALAEESDCLEVLNLLFDDAKTDLTPNQTAVLGKIENELIELAKQPIRLPTIPMRKQLSPNDWNGIWSQFNRMLGKKQETTILEESLIDKWKSKLIQNEQKLFKIFSIHHQMSFELSSKWLETMFEGDDSYWIDCQFRWAIRIDGFGYCYALGDWESIISPS